MDTNKKLLFEDEARQRILEGVEILAQAVRVTLGPRGRNVVIERIGQAPHLTKDGVTVARSINLKDQFANLGAQMLKEVASQTVDVAGDGPQPLYSKVLTPHGWKLMGELKIGDKICGTNNTVQEVLEIYPKGIKDVYQVITSGDRTVECCEDHLWKVVTSYGKEYTLTAKQLIENEIIKYYTDRKRHKYYIPTTCVEFEDKVDLPLDPYLVGALLGDGYLSEGGSVELSIGLKEEFILDKMNLPEKCGISKKCYFDKNYIKVRFTGIGDDGKSIIKKPLSQLELLGLKSHTKFIPKCYLFSTVENRKKLLDGLIDTDGHINKKGLFEYGTVSKQLHLDFIDLCRSLGKQVYVYKVERKPNDGSYGIRPIYRVCELKGYKHGIKIKKIKKTNKQTEMQCIKVSNSDHLYITDDYVVTHNTTTATILAHAIYKEGLKLIAGGHNPADLKKGIDAAVEIVTQQLTKNSVEVKDSSDIMHIGTVSANGDDSVGKMLSEAMDKVGHNGVITVEEAKGYKTTLEVVEGMQFNRGYTSPFFVTNNEKLTAELEDPYILITNKKYDNVKDLLPVLEPLASSKKPILVIVDDIDGEALNALTINKMKGVINVCAIRGPEFGSARHSMLEDIAILTGGKIVSDASGIKESDININDENQNILGTATKVIVGKGTTTIVAKKDRKEQVDKRVEEIKAQLNEPALSEEEVKLLKRRLSRMSGGVAILRVGGSTEVEMRERKDRVDDALCATQAAVEAGIVPGGGAALVHASKTLDENDADANIKYGIQIVKEACKAPLMQIVKNAGCSPDVILEKIIKQDDKNYGWNASTEEFCNLIDDGIIDPVKVPIVSLQNAASVGSLMLTIECAVAEDDPSTIGRLMEQMQV